LGAELSILQITAASLAFFHTILGPDHYIPFVMMARARKWSYFKTGWITFLCGLGHVGSSVVLGIIGISLGLAITKVTSFEGFRGNLAAWALIAFGLIYFAWGLRKAIKGKTHTHKHVHFNGSEHSHAHKHTGEHSHIHASQTGKKEITPWVLFTIFILGPCEPLIPILMYPAAKNSWVDVALVAGLFSVVTIATMILSVGLILYGSQYLPKKNIIERYMHAIGGATICLCGVGIQFLGL